MSFEYDPSESYLPKIQKFTFYRSTDGWTSLSIVFLKPDSVTNDGHQTSLNWSNPVQD